MHDNSQSLRRRALHDDRERAESDLSALNQALDALAGTESIEQIKQIHDKAEALRVFVRSSSMGLGLQNQVAEIKFRAERKAGTLLAAARLWGGRRHAHPTSRSVRLADLGITKQQSFRWQKEASIPEADFVQFVRNCQEAGRELTAAGLLRLARHSAHEGVRMYRRNGTLLKVRAGLADLIAQQKTFRCIYVGPSWMGPPRETAPEPPAAIRLADLAQLPLRRIADENAHLHLHTSVPRLKSAIRLVEIWGFRYRSVCIVAKPIPTYGSYWREGLELVVLGERGRLPFRDNGVPNFLRVDERLTTVEVVRHALENASPGPYLQLFAAGNRDRWHVLPGNGAG